ncbi:shufflon system plasmid conjugative transfer pilus tip adhesin PilV [Herbaspirillum sp. DW155]|uniref:shufflon system plasmid conjugative transfer pilus tip adhesin PilV n=1 Tax=Herbaspirillum sp. DW155 TaxID=3095609 RepID=UPI0030931B58|nr:shufflon system plasmid conjugative transfer pilus tip adhesin PilV [Herbaspirillum sp. DW155]
MPHPSSRIRPQRGFAIIEVLGALVIGSMILLGLAHLIDDSIDDLKGTQTAYYQSQISAAAAKYLSINNQALQSATPTASTVVAIGLADLKAAKLVASGMAPSNPYGQIPCVLVRQPDPTGHPGQFDALVITSGGNKIPDREIAAVSMNAGLGSGYITAANPGVARGASWSMATDAYRSVACSGAPALSGGAADGGHLVSSLFYDGPGQLSTDFLYRSAVPGRPELNRMNTPVRFASTALVQSGTSCLNAAGVAEAGIAIDSATRNLITCASNGRWSSSSQWREPVASWAALPSSGNQAGDVRMVTGLSRAFTYDGAKWVALAVDQQGNMTVPGTLDASKLAASQSVSSGGTITATGDINSQGNVGAGNDMSAGRNMSVGIDLAVGKNINVDNIYAQGNVNSKGGMHSPRIQLYDSANPHDPCNYNAIDDDGNPFIKFPIGTILMDQNATPLICYQDKTFRYANGTYSP